MSLVASQALLFAMRPSGGVRVKEAKLQPTSDAIPDAHRKTVRAKLEGLHEAKVLSDDGLFDCQFDAQKTASLTLEATKRGLPRQARRTHRSPPFVQRGACEETLIQSSSSSPSSASFCLFSIALFKS
eukprot:COSAG02_NODE_14219_length_1296_cov_1.050125_3_plen_127_part_01